MRKKRPLLILLFALFVVVNTTGQETNFSTAFRVSEKDLVNNIYPQDSLATALVVYEYGNSFIEQAEYSVVTNYEKKVKILKPDGFEHATIKLYLYQGKHGYEKVDHIKATSYTKENGKVAVVEMDKSQIFKEELNENYSTVTFTLPNVKVGSVITYSYTLRSPYIYNFHNWEFQSDIPKLHSEYRTKIPANYNYNIKLVGIQKLDKNQNEIERDCFTYGSASADCTKSYYLMKNIPAFVEEDYMTARDNYLSEIEYELMQVKYFDGRVDDITKEWKDADKEIRTKSLGKELRKSSSVKGLLPESIVSEPDLLQKAKAIFEYVQDNYVWNEEYYLYTNISVKKLIEDKTGNIGSINTLLHNLLKANGIEVHPVISSTRGNGLPTKLFPVPSEFNYLLVKASIAGKIYLLDASDPYVSFGQLPFRCLNTYGRQLDFKKGSDWVSLENKKGSMSFMSLDLEFTDQNSLKGKMKTGYSGYHALTKKKGYYPNPNSYKDELQEEFDGFEIKNYALKCNGPNDEKFKEELELEKKFDAEIKSGIYLDPYFYKFFTKNPFKLQHRTYPVDFGFTDSYLYKLNLDVGEFYEIGELPKTVQISLPDRKGDLVCNCTKSGNMLTVVFRLNFRESQYQPVLYEGLKKLMEKAVATQLNSIVVLNKK